jgi:undecaprenyl-diphosphatase
MWPGVSRSGATIMGAMVLGLERKAAVEYSFLAAVPVMIAATGYELLKSLKTLSASDAPIFAAGFITAFITAVIAIKLFVRLVRSNDLQPFGWYRIALAIVVFAVLALGPGDARDRKSQTEPKSLRTTLLPAERSKLVTSAREPE